MYVQQKLLVRLLIAPLFAWYEEQLTQDPEASQTHKQPCLFEYKVLLL